MRYFLKWLLIIGFILIVLAYFSGDGQCQENSNEKILTEISVDVKYIKQNIGELKDNFKDIQEEIKGLEHRVTNVENKTANLESIVCSIESINKWFLGILATIIGGLILYQYRRANNFRKDDRA
jgi:peptidoglycan hydrolase CwlO-like protein